MDFAAEFAADLAADLAADIAADFAAVAMVAGARVVVEREGAMAVARVVVAWVVATVVVVSSR